MKLNSITTELMVDDMATSLAFYQDNLEFEIITQAPEQGIPFFVILKKDDCELMLYQRREFVKEIPSFAYAPLGGSMVSYFEVDNVQEIYDRLSDKVELIQRVCQYDCVNGFFGSGVRPQFSLQI